MSGRNSDEMFVVSDVPNVVPRGNTTPALITKGASTQARVFADSIPLAQPGR
jgi:hypothetical protein